MNSKYDIIIVGAGPAGVSAALTARRRSKTVCVIGNPPETSALYLARHIGNYPGLNAGGAELTKLFHEQLLESGSVYVKGRVLGIMPLGAAIGVSVGSEFYEGTAVIIAAGSGRKPICEGETEFLGRGVSYCATCDAMLYRGKTVAAIGEGEEFEADVSLLREVCGKVYEFTGKESIEIKGGMKADTLVVDGTEYKTDCVFILKDTLSIGSLANGIETENGAIVVDRAMATSIPGVFAAGDCTGSPRQLVKAVGEGNVAAISASKYIEKIKNGG